MAWRKGRREFQGFFWGYKKGSYLEKVRQMEAKPTEHCSQDSEPLSWLVVLGLSPQETIFTASDFLLLSSVWY